MAMRVKSGRPSESCAAVAMRVKSGCPSESCAAVAMRIKSVRAVFPLLPYCECFPVTKPSSEAWFYMEFHYEMRLSLL